MPRPRTTTPLNTELAALGWALEVLIARQGMTQADLGDASGLGKDLVSEYVRGQVDPRFKTLLRLCDGLRVQSVELFALVKEYLDRARREEAQTAGAVP